MEGAVWCETAGSRGRVPSLLILCQVGSINLDSRSVSSNVKVNTVDLGRGELGKVYRSEDKRNKLEQKRCRSKSLIKQSATERTEEDKGTESMDTLVLFQSVSQPVSHS